MLQIVHKNSTGTYAATYAYVKPKANTLVQVGEQYFRVIQANHGHALLESWRSDAPMPLCVRSCEFVNIATRKCRIPKGKTAVVGQCIIVGEDFVGKRYTVTRLEGNIAYLKEGYRG